MSDPIRAGVRWVRRLPERAPWIDRAQRTVNRYREQRGNHLSAAVAFYTVIAAVPLLVVAFAGLGFVTFWRTLSVEELERAVDLVLPPGLATAIEPIVATAVEQRGSLFGIGALGVIWAGSMWMSYLREALSAQFCLEAERIFSPRRLLRDVLALLVLGAAVFSSITVTFAVTGLAGATLELFGLRDGLGGRIVLGALGAAAVLVLDWAVICFVLARMPRTPVSLARVKWPALVGAVALELLKLGIALIVGVASDTAGGAVFTAVLASLFFLFLLSRLLVILAAWIATGDPDDPAGPDDSDDPDDPVSVIGSPAPAPRPRPGDPDHPGPSSRGGSTEPRAPSTSPVGGA